MHIICMGRLMVWDFLSLEKGELKEDLTAVCNYPTEGWREEEDAEWKKDKRQRMQAGIWAISARYQEITFHYNSGQTLEDSCSKRGCKSSSSEIFKILIACAPKSIRSWWPCKSLKQMAATVSSNLNW